MIDKIGQLINTLEQEINDGYNITRVKQIMKVKLILVHCMNYKNKLKN